MEGNKKLQSELTQQVKESKFKPVNIYYPIHSFSNDSKSAAGVKLSMN